MLAQYANTSFRKYDWQNEERFDISKYVYINKFYLKQIVIGFSF